MSGWSELTEAIVRHPGEYMNTLPYDLSIPGFMEEPDSRFGPGQTVIARTNRASTKKWRKLDAVQKGSESPV
jgi:hypothetical protein